MNELPDLNQKGLDYLINHIVFPIKLPQESELEDEKDEIYFLKLISIVVSDLKNEFEILKDSKEYEQIIRLVNAWDELQGNSSVLESKILWSQIQSLKENQSFAVYLRAQNSCLLIKIKESLAVISTFQASLENNQIISSENEIEAEFPSQSILSDSFEIINSKDFAELLADLSNNQTEESQATTQKARAFHVEIRDVANTKLITEWLLATLVLNSEHKYLPKKSVKKYRDDVLLSKNSLLPFRRSGKLN